MRKLSRLGEVGRVRLTLVALVAVTVLAALLVPALPSSANHTGTVSGVFESKDGNLVVNDATDWNSFTNTTTAASWSFHKSPLDKVGNPDDIYAGGTKQDDDCPTIRPEGSLGSGSGKIDLTRIYLAHQAATVGSVTNDFLFIAWRRVDGSDAASSHVGYEFNRGTANCTNGNGLKQRIRNDVLIVFDFSGGDADATFKVLRWKVAGDPDTCEVANHAPPCWGDKLTLTATNADGGVNKAESVFDAITNDTLGLVQFGEGALNLDAAGIDPCDLNGTVTGVSRSSGDSGSAQMKDRVGPVPFSLPGCTQATTITTLERLGDKATINGFDATFVGDHTGDLTFRLFGPGDTTCTGTPVYTFTLENVTTGGPFHTGQGTAAATDDYYEVPANAEGIYRWKVNYSGDSANLASESACGFERADVQYGA